MLRPLGFLPVCPPEMGGVGQNGVLTTHIACMSSLAGDNTQILQLFTTPVAMTRIGQNTRYRASRTQPTLKPLGKRSLSLPLLYFFNRLFATGKCW